MNRDMEEKGIVLQELSCWTCRRAPSSRKASAAVQLPEYTAGAARLPPKLQRRPDGFDGGQTAAEASTAVRFGGSPAEKGIVLPELSYRAAAEFPPPELLVPWSTKS
ncbi:unnamed protein product [Boreogadus saida]